MDDADTIAPALMLLLDGQHHHYHPFTNESAEDAPTLTVGAAIKTAVLSFMAVASLVGNSATLINITRRRRGTRSSMYTLLLQVIYQRIGKGLVCCLILTNVLLATVCVYQYSWPWQIYLSAFGACRVKRPGLTWSNGRVDKSFARRSSSLKYVEPLKCNSELLRNYLGSGARLRRSSH